MQKLTSGSRFRPSLHPHKLALFPESFPPSDAQACQHEIPRSNHSYRIEDDITPDGLYLFRVSESAQATSSPNPKDEVSRVHHAVHFNHHLTSSHATRNQGSDSEHQSPPLPSSADYRVKRIHLLSEQLNNVTRIAAESPLLRWLHERNNLNITFTERLEKSNWEDSTLKKL